jgi:hypothetical protein
MKLDLVFELGLKILEFEKMCHNQNYRAYKFEKWGSNLYLKNLVKQNLVSKSKHEALLKRKYQC